MSVFASARPLTIFIDAGHGGVDRGASTRYGNEAEIILDVAKELEARLKKDRQFRVVMSRNDDRFLGLEKRLQNIEKKMPDILLSLHCNSSPDPRAKGLEIFTASPLDGEKESLMLAELEAEHEEQTTANLRGFPTYNDPNLQRMGGSARTIVEDLMNNARLRRSGELAKHIAKNWSGELKTKKFTIMQAPFYLVSAASMPSVLIEIGFLSHTVEGPNLSKSWYQQQVASNIHMALSEFKESMDKSPAH